MMKPKSVSALVYKVADMDKTVSFYESLGFKVTKNDGQIVVAYINWFSIEFHLTSDIDDRPKDGPSVLVSVDLDESMQVPSPLGINLNMNHKRRYMADVNLLCAILTGI